MSTIFETEKHKPWEKLPNEGIKPWEAFLVYRDLGVGRSLVAVGRQLGKSKVLMERWSSKYKWQKRVAAYDAVQDAIRLRAQDEVVARVAAEAAETLELSTWRTLLEVARLSYADIRKAVNWDEDGNVSFTRSDKLDEHTAAAISEFTVTYDKQGRKIPKLKFHNKLSALNLAGQTQGLWQKETQQTTSNNNYMIFLNEMREFGEKLKVIKAKYIKVEEARKENRES